METPHLQVATLPLLVKRALGRSGARAPLAPPSSVDPGALDALLERVWTEAEREQLEALQLGVERLGNQRGPAFAAERDRLARVASDLDTTGGLSILLDVRLQTLEEAQPPPEWRTADTFAREATHLTIWIDEAWPTHEFPEGDVLEDGVIAGVVFVGEPDPRALPIPRQHLRTFESFDRRARRHLLQLAACERALPFAFRFRCPEGRDAQADYLRLVLETLRLLLGWYLPSDGPACDVDVTCESLAWTFRHGHDATRALRDLLDAQDATARARFARWNLRRVRWQSKDLGPPETFDERTVLEQGYLGFGDLLAYVLTFPKPAGVRAWLQPERLPVRLQLHLDEFTLLSALDRVVVSASAVDLLAVEERFGSTGLWPRLVPVVRSALAATPELVAGVMNALTERLRSPSRDLRAIAATVRRLEEVLAQPLALAQVEDPATAALWHLAGMQIANHRGDPVEAGRFEAACDALRPALEDADLDVLAFAELNRAVADADRLLFGRALERIEGVRLASWHGSLSKLRRGYVSSARGQYLAMLGRSDEATAAFDEALALFRAAPMSAAQRAREIDQTSVYRAFHLLSADPDRAEDAVRDVFAAQGIPTLEDAIDVCARDTLAHAYRHHLLLRAVWERGLSHLQVRYALRMPDWAWGHQHPWTLIGAYRGRFLLEQHLDDAADDAWRRAIAGARSGGPTLQLLGATVATMRAATFEGSDDDARGLLAVAETLEGAAEPIARLREILADPESFDDPVEAACAVLPFNYR